MYVSFHFYFLFVGRPFCGSFFSNAILSGLTKSGEIERKTEIEIKTDGEEDAINKRTPFLKVAMKKYYLA